VNRRIGRLGIGLLVAYALLFAQLNRVQVFGAQRLVADPGNARVAVDAFGAPRGRIATADGVVVAESEATDPGGTFEHRRRYPHGELYAHLTGYVSFTAGNTGLEQRYDEVLGGRTAEQRADDLYELFAADPDTADVIMTVRHDVQAVAAEALGDRVGAVVFVEPVSGDVLALWSSPTYDPNLLADTATGAAADARAALLADPADPLLARATGEIFAPGSTFKVVTAAAAIEVAGFTLDDPLSDVTAAYVPPLTNRPITNYGGSSCGGPLRENIRASCNTAFALIGAELVGPEGMVGTAEGFGFNEEPPFDLPTATSRFPDDYGRVLSMVTGPDGVATDVPVVANTPLLAQASIGQYDVAATPLQMALVAAAVASDGTVPVPRLVGEVLDRTGRIVEAATPATWTTAMAPGTAAAVREGMIGVVVEGTARRLAVDGLVIGAKTGTAQLAAGDDATHAWIVGFAGHPGMPAAVAFAVLVAADPEVGEQTGGRVAAPIAREVLLELFGLPG